MIGPLFQFLMLITFPNILLAYLGLYSWCVSIRVSCPPDCLNLNTLDSPAAKSLKIESNFKIQIYHRKEWFQLCYPVTILLLCWNISGTFFFHIKTNKNLKQLNPEFMFPVKREDISQGHLISRNLMEEQLPVKSLKLQH